MANGSLQFMMQDEELIVAGAAVDDLTAAHQQAAPVHRKSQIAISLAIRFYDDTFKGDAGRSRCQARLLEKIAAWRAYRDDEYVSQDVAERLNIQ